MIALAFYSAWFGPSAGELALGETGASLADFGSLNFAGESATAPKRLFFSYSSWLFSSSLISFGLSTNFKSTIPMMILYEAINLPEVTVYNDDYSEGGTLKLSVQRISLFLNKKLGSKLSAGLALHYNTNRYSYTDVESRKVLSSSVFARLKAGNKLSISASGFNTLSISVSETSGDTPPRWFLLSTALKVSPTLKISLAYDSFKQLSIGAKISSPKGFSLYGSWGSSNPAYMGAGLEIKKGKLTLGLAYISFPTNSASSFRGYIALNM